MPERDAGWVASVGIDIAAAPQQVWDLVSDIREHPALAGSGEVLSVTIDGPIAVGTTFDSDVRTGEVGSFSPRCVITEVDEPRAFGWVSLPPLDPGETEDHQIEVHWRFVISDRGDGAHLAHHLRIPPPRLGADVLGEFFERTDRLATVRRGMTQTVANVKARLESPPT